MAMLATPITIAAPEAVDHALNLAQQAKERGADLVEWRVDALTGDAISHQAVVRLVKEVCLPCILTCRTAMEGGGFDGPEADRVDMLGTLLEADTLPRYLDVEFSACLVDAPLCVMTQTFRDKGTSLILSTHDFDGRPSDLIRRVADMGAAPCDVIKVAYHAKAIREALECADLLASRPKPMIALAMGEAGLVSRVFAGAWGGLLTFASLHADDATAPGQPTLENMRDRYRFAQINEQTRLYGLVGWPLGDSPGLTRHNEMFAEAGWNAVYVPLPVREGWERFKADVLSCIDHPKLHFGGVSVTMPHKANCLRFVQEAHGEIGSAASVAGASNTLIVQPSGDCRATNTDVVGVIEPLRALGATFDGGMAAVIGAGGAARAACVGLLQAGARVRVFNRTQSRAQQVVDDLQSVGDIGVGGNGPFTIVVQCTSVGMAHGSQPGGNAMEGAEFDMGQVAKDAVALESVYDPLETVFVRAMREAGAQVATGSEMWATQAQAQQTMWANGGW
jgi:3-dehydroquinate dehydratase/shikimate dehydrogenase